MIFKESMGLFWYDRYKAVAEAALNLGISIAGYALWRCWRFCRNLFQYCAYLRVGRALCDIQIQAEKTDIHIFYKIWCISCRNGFRMVDNRAYMQAFYRRAICLPDLQRDYLCDRAKPAALGGLQENRKLEKMEGLLHHVLRKILQIRGRRQS